MKRHWKALLSFGVIAFSLPVFSAEKLAVATTTTMVTDLVKAVGGPRVTVTGLMGPGVDPHLYKPGAKDIGQLSRASVIFYSGLMLEGRMADLFSKMARRGKRVYAVTESIPEDKLMEPESFEGHWDPHVWGDPNLWSRCIDTVVTALSENDPKGKPSYQERGARVKAESGELFDWAKKRSNELSETQRILITSHDAFNYFGRAFGFEVVGVCLPFVNFLTRSAIYKSNSLMLIVPSLV